MLKYLRSMKSKTRKKIKNHDQSDDKKCHQQCLIRLIMIMKILDCSDIGLCRQVEGGQEARLEKKYSFYLVIQVIPKVISV